MTKKTNKNKALSNALTGAALVVALTPTAMDVVNVAAPGVDTDDTAYAKTLAQGKAFVQMGVTTVDLQDSTGYVYPAGTVVARSSKDDSGASGSYYVHLFVGLTSNIGYGIVPESYVRSTSTSIIDIDSNGKVVSSSYLTDAGKYETFKPSQDGGTTQTDKGALKSNLDSASQKINSGLYTDTTVANLQAQYNNALAVYNDTSVNQTQVDTANANLANAINALVEKPAAVNKDSLNATIDSTSSAYDNQANYTADSFSKFDAAFNTAVSVSNDPNATQLQVDNATNSLSYTFGKLVVQAPVVNKDSLNATISKAQGLVDSGKYTDDTVAKVSQEIQTATSVANDTNATQSQVDEANTNLTNAINGLVEKPAIVDKSNLETAISSSKEALKDSDKYTDSSVSAVKTAQSNAQNVFDNADATQSDVDLATSNLNKAVSELTVKPVVINKADLEKAIADSEEAIKDESKYTVASVNDVKTYQSAAKKVLSDSNATQSQVDIATNNLNNAVTNLVEAEKPMPEADKNELEKVVKDAKTKLDDSDKYTAETVKKLQTSYDSAVIVLNDKNSTQTQTDAATADVKNAIDELVVKPAVVNKSDLEKAVSNAETKLKDETKYTTDTVTSLKTAITSAKEILNDSNATQEQVDASTKEVTDATNSLKEKPAVVVNKKALEDKLSDAKVILDNPLGFTDASIKNLKSENDKATKVLNDKNATQLQVDAAVNSLDGAIKALVKTPTTPELVNKADLEKAVSSAKKELENSDKYTAESVKDLQTAYDKAITVLKDTGATKAQVDNAKSSLDKAISGLKVKPVGPVTPEPEKPKPVKPTTPGNGSNKPGSSKPSTGTNETKPVLKDASAVDEKTTNDYVVVEDDTLTYISQKHNVSLADLLKANPGITNPDVIFEGQLINIPKKVEEVKAVIQDATSETKKAESTKTSNEKEVKKDDAKKTDAQSEKDTTKSDKPYSKQDSSTTEKDSTSDKKDDDSLTKIGLGAAGVVGVGAVATYLSKRKKKGNGPSL